MSEKFFSIRNLKFNLYEVFNIESLLDYEYFQDHSRDTFDIMLDTAQRIAKEHMYPYYSEMDKNPPQFVNERIVVNPIVRKYMEIAGEGGWITAQFSYEHYGQQMPTTIFNSCLFIKSAANYSLSVYPGLTTGAAHLIFSYGSKELQETYGSLMSTGKWQGTMALTEPEAGSSLGDVKTTASPEDGGYYLIRGQKTFISAGDHDGVDNIVHLMLARINGAPEGVKGLSLFVVPRLRLSDDGTLEFNDVNTSGCYHKMGYRGTPIAQLSMGESGDCRGYLLGEENMGLRYMFQMMNEARIQVGLGATGIATAAYYSALQYTQERHQGRSLTEKNPMQPQVPLVEHPDIKRMLLQQRAIAEGSLSLVIYTGKLVDMIKVQTNEEKEKHELLLELLTPIVKSYPSEMGIVSTSQGIQCFGGYGYSDEFPAEQYLRDMRIHPIHEGTTGIQGMDLLGRKVTMAKGKALHLYFEEVAKTIGEAKPITALNGYAEKLSEAMELLHNVTEHLISIAMKDKMDLFLADATLYIEFFGIICIAWQWLIQGIAVQKKLNDKSGEDDKAFYAGKMYTMQYFFEYEVPKIQGLAIRLNNSDGLTIAVKAEHFFD